MRILQSAAAAALALALSASMVSASSEHPPAPEKAPEKIAAISAKPSIPAPHGGAPHWDYQGLGGPANWGKLETGFGACEMGATQSPINLQPTLSADLPAIFFNYAATPTAVTNNGHTLQVNVFEGSSIMVDGKEFPLAQFHFHTPSEYQIDGKAFPLEIHFVHKNAQGVLAVIGVMVQEGAANSELDGIFAAAPREGGRTQQLPDATTDIRKLLPSAATYYRLMGSLTTPPCSEGVHWHVMTTPIEASKAQIDKFRTYFAMNARPLQPANNRLVVRDSR